MQIPVTIDRRDQVFAGRYVALSPARRLCWHVVTLGGYAEVWWPIYAALLVGGHFADRPAWFELGTRLFAAEALGLALLIPLRYLFRRARPTPKKPALFIIPWERYSFPSSHALRGLATATVLTGFRPMIGFAVIPLAVLVAWSRMPLRRHYLSDVITGAILGTACGLAAGLVITAMT